MALLRIALATNGVAMFMWSFILFFKHYALWAKGEGRKAADRKTKFDVMIWRIVGLWVAFVGLACLFVTETCRVVSGAHGGASRQGTCT